MYLHAIATVLMLSLNVNVIDAVPSSWVIDENNVTIATIKNATVDEIAFTSFENTTAGYWSYAGAPQGSIADKGKTGNKYYVLSSGNITKSNLAAQRYIVSYWSKAGTVSVSGTNLVTIRQSTRVANGWTLTENLIEITSTGSVTLSGTAKIDEVRLLPADAKMNTNTYDALIGTTSKTDENNVSVYYEYDEFGRLKLTRDENNQILQTIETHFKS